MRHLLLAGRTSPTPTFSTANSSLLGTTPYALSLVRDEPLDEPGGKLTFACWVYRTTTPASKYVLFRAEANDSSHYIEVAIVSGNRLRVMIGELGRATATYLSPIGSLPIDAYYRHVCAVVDTSQAQEERRVTFYIDGIEKLSAMVNPPGYLSELSAIGYNETVYVMGTSDAVTQLNGNMALAYAIFGRALSAGFFIVGSGSGMRTRTFSAAQGDSDIHLPLATDFVDDFNEHEFTLIP